MLVMRQGGQESLSKFQTLVEPGMSQAWDKMNKALVFGAKFKELPKNLVFKNILIHIHKI